MVDQYGRLACKHRYRYQLQGSRFLLVEYRLQKGFRADQGHDLD